MGWVKGLGVSCDGGGIEEVGGKAIEGIALCLCIGPNGFMWANIRLWVVLGPHPKLSVTMAEIGSLRATDRAFKGVRPSTSASESQPSGNTKKDKIQQTQSSTQKNKVEAHPRTVKSSMRNKKLLVEPKEIQCAAFQAYCELLTPLCVSVWITPTDEVRLGKPTALESDTPKPVVTLVYLRKPKKSKTNVPVSKPKNIKSLPANKKEPSKSWGSRVYDVPSSSLDECRSSKLFSGIWTPAAPSI
ncbi:hypothetical protein Tco_1343739 [Tanacetum coccineum]